MRTFNKTITRTLLLLLIFIAIVPFVYPLKNGKPLLSFNLRLPSLPDIPLPTQDNKSESTPVTAYKWRDHQGNWQFGGRPPQDVPYETVELDPNANLLPGVKAAPASPTADEKTEKASQPDTGEVEFGYTPGKIEAMMEKTRQARDAMDARHRSLESLDQ